MKTIVYRAVWFTARFFYMLLWWPRLINTHHLPKGGYLLCTNHRSWFDPPLVGCHLWGPIAFFAKAELFRNPVAKWFLDRLNALPVRRGAVDRNALKTVMNALSAGLPVLVFPEGTRSRTGKMLPPRPGIGFLARQGNAPIVPAYISGADPVRRSLFRWGRMRMTFGAPITLAEINSFPDQGDGYRDLSRLIMRRICDLAPDPERAWAEATGQDAP